MEFFIKKLLYIFSILLLSLEIALAAQEFIIEDIRLEGLERITPGTVFNYLPMKVGDKFDDTRSGEAVRALFKTGFFDDVRLERDGDILVFIFKERPSIGSISVSGNSDIETDDLMSNLRQIGFAEGRAFEKSQLDGVEQELRRQYFSLGKYGVRVESTVTPLDKNRVAIAIDISEGIAARIQQINIVGNNAFSEKRLLKEFKLSTPTMFSFFTKVDQYSRQKLSADLESLRSYYLDHGYVNFNIDSTQVSITPDKKDIYITVNISEGEPYTISEVKLAGELIVPEEELFDLVKINMGNLFSRKDVTGSSTRITERLGDEGYAFANVNSIPDINKEDKTVALTFFIDPGKRVYVRRINFSGNAKTREEVLRREMRLQEGGWISTTKVQRGKVRLQKLGYFKDVNVETPAVPGTTDQVDVNYTVEESPSGNLMAGVGFSQTAGITFQTTIVQDNFLGSGKRVSFAFNNSDVNRRFVLGYMNPYYTVDGVSRGFDAFYRETDAGDANITVFDSTEYGGAVGFGLPVTEFNHVSVALEYARTEIDARSNVASQVTNFIAKQGDLFDILRLSSAFSYDTRNRHIFPDKGVWHRIMGEVALPGFGDSLEFFKLEYKTQWIHSVFQDYILSLRGQVGYGDGIFDTNELPFFENFYAGGPRTVRGYKDNTLGPLDSVGRPLGGNLKLVGNAEVILPVPYFKDVKSVRISGFFDGGNVYGNDEDFDIGELRYSAGVSGIWISPFGQLSASFAIPIADQASDDTQTFQFTFGTNF
ncbi:MAG: outer membrane protein assembly factor BamA [Gammaproteobacteria bacterium]